MAYFKKALLPVDMSEEADRAVQKAAELVNEGFIGSLVLLNVYDTAQVDITKLHNREHLDELREASQATLKKYEAVLQDKGITPQMKRAGGDPASLILDVVENDPDIDLVVMGSRKLNKFQELVLGSVSDKVTRLVKVPVFIVK